jgi:predicted HAD superfamily Cof-like phosphohydrolase
MKRLYKKYGFFADRLTYDQLRFRAELQLEEAQELMDAIKTGNKEEIVDALIDSEVISTGTISLLRIDGDRAWRTVYKANSKKKRGVKKGREQSNGFDLMKEPSWHPPSHYGNTGVLDVIYK